MEKIDYKLANEIKDAIHSHIGVPPAFVRFLPALYRNKYKSWYCGITYDVKERIDKHNREKEITATRIDYWNAGDVDTASHIEDFFSDKGMRNNPGKRGAKDKSTFVYVFYWPPDSEGEDINYLWELLGLE